MNDTLLDLRDKFAGQAMQSLILNQKTISAAVPLSVRAYEIADSMLDERLKASRHLK